MTQTGCKLTVLVPTSTSDTHTTPNYVRQDYFCEDSDSHLDEEQIIAEDVDEDGQGLLFSHHCLIIVFVLLVVIILITFYVSILFEVNF